MSPSLGFPVEVTLNGRHSLCGSIFSSNHGTGRPRLLDFLIRTTRSLLPVVDAREVFLINTQKIAHVREA